MPIGSNQTAVSSLSSVISSIENDRQTYRWFLMLISLPEIQQKLSLKDKTREKYLTFKKIQISEIITCLVLALIMAVTYTMKQPWAILTGIFPLIILLILFQNNRRCVAAISEEFLLENIQPDVLVRQTLFQTCENFSKKYNVPSLVDIIAFQDFIGRKVLLGAILILPFIFYIKVWQIWVVIFILCTATLAITNTSIVLRKLK